jgi:hypothetical protein
MGSVTLVGRGAFLAIGIKCPNSPAARTSARCPETRTTPGFRERATPGAAVAPDADDPGTLVRPPNRAKLDSESHRADRRCAAIRSSHPKISK